VILQTHPVPVPCQTAVASSDSPKLLDRASVGPPDSRSDEESAPNIKYRRGGGLTTNNPCQACVHIHRPFVGGSTLIFLTSGMTHYLFKRGAETQSASRPRVVGVVFGMSEDWNATGVSSRVSGDVERNM
jgi:hypothetical protein